VQPALRLGGHVARRGGGVDPFVQVNNLNRFSSLPGYFNTAHEAGRFRIPLVRHAAAEAALEPVRGIRMLASAQKLSQKFATRSCSVGRSGVKFSPMTSSTTPVSAAAEQKYQNNDNEGTTCRGLGSTSRGETMNGGVASTLLSAMQLSFGPVVTASPPPRHIAPPSRHRPACRPAAAVPQTR
jgi:hypothetical protein